MDCNRLPQAGSKRLMWMVKIRLATWSQGQRLTSDHEIKPART